MRSALAALLFLGAAAAAQAQSCASCNAGVMDPDSRLCVPNHVDGASTARRPQARSGPGNPLAAAYAAMSNRLLVNVVLYDRGHPTDEADDEEMRRTVAAALEEHKNAKLEMGGSTVLSIGGDPTRGEAAWMSWSEGLTDYVSLLWLLPRGPRWLQIRAQYVRPPENTGDAADFALGFVRSIAGAICRVR